MMSTGVKIYAAENGWILEHEREPHTEPLQFVFTNWDDILEHLRVNRVLVVPTEEPRT